MKLHVECPNCGRCVPASDVAIEDGRCIVQCAKCGRREEAELDVREPAQVFAGPSPQNVCPKCGHARQEDANSCPRCGLVFALWKPPEKPFADFPQLAASWKELESQPVSGVQHDRFLEACFQQGALPDAARAYKARLQSEPEAAARLRQIELLSQMRLIPKSESKPRRWRFLVWILLALTLAAALYLLTITPEDLMR